jgi:hypothetical protein
LNLADNPSERKRPTGLPDVEGLKAVAFLLIRSSPFKVKTPLVHLLWQLFIRLAKEKVPQRESKRTKILLAVIARDFRLCLPDIL